MIRTFLLAVAIVSFISPAHAGRGGSAFERSLTGAEAELRRNRCKNASVDRALTICKQNVNNNVRMCAPSTSASVMIMTLL